MNKWQLIKAENHFFFCFVTIENNILAIVFITTNIKLSINCVVIVGFFLK